MTKPLAKSLHTVTVLVRVSKMLLDQGISHTTVGAVADAAGILGLADMPDLYGLKSAAVTQLRKGK